MIHPIAKVYEQVNRNCLPGTRDFKTFYPLTLPTSWIISLVPFWRIDYKRTVKIELPKCPRLLNSHRRHSARLFQTSRTIGSFLATAAVLLHRDNRRLRPPTRTYLLILGVTHLLLCTTSFFHLQHPLLTVLGNRMYITVVISVFKLTENMW